MWKTYGNIKIESEYPLQQLATKNFDNQEGSQRNRLLIDSGKTMRSSQTNDITEASTPISDKHNLQTERSEHFQSATSPILITERPQV